ncbi:putative ABC transport system substrate-binding protein [Acetitomaculum ruminis DSM 5522]|uniref:Putative ABC transport system substrate-binding protein n=1 Tax=Acetitomaculum ruminis DSM 5522 TaxID=1120918 RepID=A0A1I0ZR14_9FIRM|nr:ABC transporter substrate-binding protein [Acetitomaculum ruminis]SFB28229.1 putative ABC transport system substrate-binding protein [Acetitomaculum ruminis DSM 5522]
MRKFLALTLAAVMTVSLAACGGNTKTNDTSSKNTTEQTDNDEKSYKVGIIQFVDDASLNQIEKNLEDELDAKSKELGITFDYEDYTYNGQADATALNQMTAELIDKKVDIIVPIATPTAQIVQSATEENPIPVVFSAVTDPVGAGLVESMEKPGSNITGTSDALNTEAIMNLIFATNPDTDYVGLLYSKSEDASKKAIEEAKEYLDAKNIKYIEKTGTTVDEVTSAADALVAEGVDAVFTPTDNTVMTAQLSIYEKFKDAKIAHFAGADSFALNGAFLGYGVDYSNLGKETADMVVEILAEKKDPASLAVKTFDNGIATVNTEISEELGYKLEDLKQAYSDYCSDIVETQTAKEFE